MRTGNPEILAPVGSMEMCEAAVHNGADAVYVGMPGFNARGRAATLSLSELEAMMTLCRAHGVKVFVAFNVLMFEQEIRDVLESLEAVIKLSPDAFIVQDIGLAWLIRKICPSQAVHASTQMTVTNAEAIEITSDLGMCRYVLGREVSIPEMRKIRAQTEKELEVFVHGALCVSYSGQCLTSERAGGRSANRGQCAQSCRLPYQLIVDGEVRELGEKRYLVSPKDLCALEDVPELVEAGIDSFKIEGRLKSPEYVASAVRSYKDAVTTGASPSPSRIEELTRIYSRGFFNGWMQGVNHQRLVDGRYGNHHGVELGEVIRVTRDEVRIRTTATVSNGDGIMFTDFSGDDVGGPVFSVSRSGEELKLAFSRDFRFDRVHEGMTAFLNASPETDARWRKSFKDKTQLRKSPLRAVVSGSIGTPLTVEFSDGAVTARVSSTAPLAAASKAPLTKESLESELGALGGTPFELASLKMDIAEKVFLHNKELKEIRRRGVELLQSRRIQRVEPSVLSVAESRDWIDAHSRGPGANAAAPTLSVLVREKEQLQALQGLDLDTVYLDFEFGKEYGESLKEARGFGFKCGIATTRILKPAELGHLDYIRRLAPDVVLVRNLGALQYFQDKPLILAGDFSLNVSNSLTAAWMLERKLVRLCPSYDLNQPQLLDLIDRAGSDIFEVTVHQYMPAFHMEHCVFAAFLSSGTSYRDCGRPCERHRVELKDPSGAVHPLKADAECRNTMFNGIPQSAARLVPELRARGIERFRLEALYETPQQLRQKAEAYLALIRGEISPSEIFDRVGVLERYGVSEGQLLNIRSYKDRKKDSELLPAG